MCSDHNVYNFFLIIYLVSVEPTLLERRLCEAFDVFDIARSGEVDVRDLGTIIRALGTVYYKIKSK